MADSRAFPGPVVLVHGVPDTHRVWDGVRAELRRDDILALDLPGFGSPVPEGFTATKEEYLDWLIGRIEAIGAPADLVGHDWGSVLVQRLSSIRPDLVRTWAAGGGPCDPDYEWHDFAKVWQTPGAGEDFMASWTPAVTASMGESYGVPASYVQEAAGLIDDVMKDCILRLYRSAVDFSSEWGPDLERAPSRALLIWGADDPFVPAEIAGRSATRVGGESLVLEGCGHWWPLERAGEVAAALTRFWRTDLP